MDFCTLGMFIIDDIYPRKSDPNQSPKLNAVGGAGTYSAIGARLFSGPPLSGSVGWVVDAGIDFPDHVRQIIDSWQTGVLLRKRDAPTTRGWNAYTDGEHRAFKYLTEKKRIVADDLNEELIRSRSFHLISSASRCTTLITEMLTKRQNLQRPLFIWEPVPDICTADELEAIRSALQHVDVISPNHEELAAIFGAKHSSDEIDRQLVEAHAAKLLAFGVGQHGQGSVVVRCGKVGAFAITESEHFWLPAYHDRQEKVIDPTGGGNGFLGGLAVGLARGETLREAVIMATVAASFCIEQVGPPVLVSSDQLERWNGEIVGERLEAYKTRLDAACRAR